MSSSSFMFAADSVGLLVKVTLLLLAAGAVSVVLRRTSASTRHFVWALALGGTAALALLSPVAPVVPVPIATAIPPVGSPNADAVRSGIGNDHSAPLAASAPATTVNADAALPPRFTAPSFSTMLMIAWGAGLAALVAWSLLGQLGLARLARTADLVQDAHWQLLLASARASVGVTRDVRLCRSAAVGAPVTWGLLRPIIMLPVDTDAWSEERRRVVLLHELAHVARRDYVVQLLASIACAMYWFHPGVWMAARRLRNESERACDDQVLALGTSAADYAAHLLSVATGARALRFGGAVAIGMARRSTLEGRLLAALDHSTPRKPVSARVRAMSTGALGMVLLPLAGVRAVDRVEPLPPVVVSAADPQADTTRELFLAAAPGERLDLNLGPGGDVDIRGWDEPRVRVRTSLRGDNWRDILVVARRDDDGIVFRSWYGIQRRTQSSAAHFEIHVPRRFDVQLSSGGGSLTITDVQGSFRGHTGGGNISLERVSGSARLSTGGGDVTVSDVDLSGSVSTGGGVVVLSRVSGGLRGYSGSGPVVYAEAPNAQTTNEPTAEIRRREVDKVRDRISLTASGAGTVHITKAGGDVTLDEAPRGAVIHTGGGRVRVGAAAGFVDASTGGGDITIGPVAGSVRAGTGAGTVEVTLIEARAEQQTVEITAGVGRVILELPESFDGRFDVETAYSRGFGRATRIVSDWDLERETTTEWDDREGTPRRYVRARGSVGRGRGLVQIKTMNGDIEVRRGR